MLEIASSCSCLDRCIFSFRIFNYEFIGIICVHPVILTKFLEDQDGASNWRCFNSMMAWSNDGMGSGSHKGNIQSGIIDTYTTTIKIEEVYANLVRVSKGTHIFQTLQQGYHFVDIPLTGRLLPLKELMLDQGDRAVRAASEINKVITGSVTMPPSDMRLYLSDFEDPKRLLQFDDLAAAGGQFQVGWGNGEKVLDGEPCGELEQSLTCESFSRWRV